MRHRIAGPALIGIAVIALAACSSTTGGSTAPSASAAAPSAAASAAVPSAAASAAASEAASAAPSEAAASLAIPSFVLPSTDKELEALLPAKMCGETATKLSMSGEAFSQSADQTFLDMLTALGKTPADVSVAISATQESGCSAGIFRIKGADPNKLKDEFLAAANKAGDKYEEISIGGKTVLHDPTSQDIQYAYFKGDGLVFFGAKNAADAASIVSQLP